MKAKEILLKVTSYFEACKIPYAIVGGFAAIAWGRVRTTYDIDIIIDHEKIDLSDFVEFCKNNSLMADLEEIKSAFIEKSHSSILFKDQPIYRIDLKGIYTQEDSEAISTAKIVTFANQKIRFGSPENLIAHKLKFGSNRDLEDALVVLLVQKEKINLDYLRELSKRLGVEKELEELLEEAEY